MVLFKKHQHIIRIMIPVVGMFLFIGFYILAAFLYPGGSFTDSNSIGFSFKNNYLCDILDSYALNGELNTASSMARIAFGILCFTMIYSWIQIPQMFTKKHVNHRIIRILGVISMIIAMFLAAGIHDIIVYLSGIFGLLALILTFLELYKHGFFFLLSIGILSFLLIVINYAVYVTGFWIQALPVIQKITFVCCISWFLMLAGATYKRI